MTMYSKSESGIDKLKIAKLADTDGYKICDKMAVLQSILTSNIQNTMQMVEFFACNYRSTVFRNLFFSIRILLKTFLVYVTPGKRNLSKIKSYLKSSWIESERTFEKISNYNVKNFVIR